MTNVVKLDWDASLKIIENTGCKELHAALKSMKLTAAQRKAFPFYKITYNYGDVIACDGKMDWDAIHTHDKEKLKELLDYAPIPLGLALNKTVELNSAISSEGKLEYIPTTLIKKGELFGVFEALDAIVASNLSRQSLGKSNGWNVIAGSYTVILNYPSTSFKPSKTAPDWKAISTIAKNQKIEWKCDILYFSKDLVQDAIHTKILTDFLFKAGWKQNQLVLAFNSIMDNALDDLAGFCHTNIKSKVKGSSHIIFWFFVRLLLVASNVRPGYILVQDEWPDSCGPFSGVLKHLKSLKRTKRSWTPMIFEPCFLQDSLEGVYSPAYQPTIVGGLSGRIGRNVNAFVSVPIETIRESLHEKFKFQWLTSPHFILLELKTKGPKNKSLNPYKYTVEPHTRQIDDPLIHVLNPYEEPLSKVLVALRKAK